jgi:hypothetical protein
VELILLSGLAWGMTAVACAERWVRVIRRPDPGGGHAVINLPSPFHRRF